MSRRTPPSPTRDPNPHAHPFLRGQVLFADVVGFTSFCSATPAAAVVRTMNALFGTFDALLEPHGIFRAEARPSRCFSRCFPQCFVRLPAFAAMRIPLEVSSC